MKRPRWLPLGIVTILLPILSQAAFAQPSDFSLDVNPTFVGVTVAAGQKVTVDTQISVVVLDRPDTIKFIVTTDHPGIVTVLDNVAVFANPGRTDKLHVIVNDTVSPGTHMVYVTGTSGCSSTGCSGVSHTSEFTVLVNWRLLRSRPYLMPRLPPLPLPPPK